MSADHLRRAARAFSLAGVLLPWLTACSGESPPPESAAAGSAGGAGQALPATPTPSPQGRALSPELRTRISKLPTFARLPGADQAWVLAQAGARLELPHPPEVEPLVQQLAEVRQFAVAEREEPLPAPRPAAVEVP